jgi:type IV secretion system protein VirD4
MYSQLFKELCDKADNVYNGRLPVHVRMILDEFANAGQIPNFEKIISVIRSREISVNVIVQNMAQIEALYDKQAGTIVGNCDTTLFLGSGEEKTMESISKRIGKETIDIRNASTTKGTQGSYSLQDQKLGRELLTPDEVGRMNNDECILFIRGLKPFKSKKLDVKAHKNYKKTADFSNKNYFNIVEYNKKKAEEKQNNDEFNIEDYLIDDEELELLELPQ